MRISNDLYSILHLKVTQSSSDFEVMWNSTAEEGILSRGYIRRMVSANIHGYSDINFYLVFDRRMLGIDTRNIREYPSNIRRLYTKKFYLDTFQISTNLLYDILSKVRGYIRRIFGYLPITLSQNLDIRIFESAHQFDIRISEYQIFSISVGYPSNIREYPWISVKYLLLLLSIIHAISLYYLI